VSPDIRRFLPLLLIGLFALVVLPQLLKKHSSSTSASTKATQTYAALAAIDKAEQAYRAAHNRYTDQIADIVDPALADDLARGLVVELGIGSDKQSYYAHVTSDVLSLVRARQGAKKIADSCVVVKSGGGVKCAAGTDANATTTTTRTTTTTTTTATTTTG
jgi:hypothetical protein